MDKESLKSILQKHIVKLNFTKADGSQRIMTCSLREDIIKPYDKKTEKTKKPNEKVLAVWDIDKEAFRSFKIESLIDYQVIQEGYEL